MSERGTLRIVVEGDDAKRFHERLTGFVAMAKENPECRLEDPEGELYWLLSTDDIENDVSENVSTLDCFSFDGRFQGHATIDWDAYTSEDGRVCLTAQWLNTLAFIALAYTLIEEEDNIYYEYQSMNWGIGTNDASSKYFEKIIHVIDWDGENVPDDWAKDWDALSFEQRVALCDKYGVCYLATEVE